MFDFFFDTADIEYIENVWGRLKNTVDSTHVRGITTNPNAFKKVNMDRLEQWTEHLPKLCALVTKIRGDNKGVVYVQAPNSEMCPHDIVKWAEYICQFTDGTTRLGLKIPPFHGVLEVVDQLNNFMETNVTGVADCSTALSCFTYNVRYVSLIPGRMEEQGVDAAAHVAFAQKRKSDCAEIIAGSMRTVKGLRDVCELGTIPTIGTRVWDKVLETKIDHLLTFEKKELTHDKFSPFIDDVNRSLSVDFFKQMDECGATAHADFMALL
jgi:transaldolase